MLQIDPAAVYEEEVTKNKTEYKMRTSRKKYAKNDEYINYRQTIYVCHRVLSADILAARLSPRIWPFRKCNILGNQCRQYRTSSTKS